MPEFTTIECDRCGKEVTEYVKLTPDLTRPPIFLCVNHTGRPGCYQLFREWLEASG